MRSVLRRHELRLSSGLAFPVTGCLSVCWLVRAAPCQALRRRPGRPPAVARAAAACPCAYIPFGYQVYMYLAQSHQSVHNHNVTVINVREAILTGRQFLPRMLTNGTR